MTQATLPSPSETILRKGECCGHPIVQHRPDFLLPNHFICCAPGCDCWATSVRPSVPEAGGES